MDNKSERIVARRLVVLVLMFLFVLSKGINNESNMIGKNPIQTEDMNKKDSKIIDKEEIMGSPECDTIAPRAAENSNFTWWNEIYEYRLPVEVGPNGETRQNPAVEIYLNFSQYLEDKGIDTSLVINRVNSSNIRVIEQREDGYSKSYPIQYDSVGPSTSDQGEITWVIDGSLSNNRTFYIYFCTGQKDTMGQDIVPSDDSRSITDHPFRLYHQGFEDPSFSIAGTNADQDHPSTGDAERTESVGGARGDACLKVRGNRWPALSVTEETAITAFDNSINPMDYNELYITYNLEIIDESYTTIEAIATGLAYDLGSGGRYTLQHWGSQTWMDEQQMFDDAYEWYHRGYDIKSKVGWDFDVNYIYTLCDDDENPSQYRGANWDDISIWNVTVDLSSDKDLEISTSNIEIVSSNFQLKVLDLDGFPVSNAHVNITNDLNPWDQWGTTDENGFLAFTNVSLSQTYNVTVKYTTSNVQNPQEFTIADVKNVILNTFNFNLTINTSLWSMDFKVKDFDGLPLENGFVIIYDEIGTPVVNNSLDSNGECTIKYQNNSKEYNYTVFLDTTLLSNQNQYAEDYLNISSGLVTRTFIDKPELITHQEFVRPDYSTHDQAEPNRTSVDKSEIYGELHEDFFGRRKVGFIQMQMINYSDNILEYQYNATMVNQDVETILSSTQTNPENLTVSYRGMELEKLHYFIKKSTSGEVGALNISYYVRTTTFVTTNTTQYTFNVTYKDEQGVFPLANAICMFKNTEGIYIANLTTTAESNLVTLVYMRWTNSQTANYSLEVKFINKKQSINQTLNPGIDDWATILNFTMNTSKKIDVLLNFQEQSYITNLKVSNLDTSSRKYLDWGEALDFSLNYKLNSSTGGDSWIVEPLTADQVEYVIKDEDYQVVKVGVIDQTINIGEYNWTFNSDILLGGTKYIIEFNAQKAGYPEIEQIPSVRITIFELPTTEKLFDDSSGEIIDESIVEKTWGETFNVSLVYKCEDVFLEGATTSIQSDFIELVSMCETNNDGFINYTYEINTSLAESLGQYLIEFEMDLANYTANSTLFFLKINPISTMIDSSMGEETKKILQISRTINETDEIMFDFSYFDSFNSIPIKNYTTAEFTWTYVDGDDSGHGTLLNNTDCSVYTLDFQTSSKAVGQYIILVDVYKEKYEERQAMIILSIQKREIQHEMVGDISETTLRVHKGDGWNLSVCLRDKSRNFTPLTTADVSFSVPSFSYECALNHTANGLYSIFVNWEVIKNLFTGETFTGHIIMENETFKPINQQITIILLNRSMNIAFGGDLTSELEVSKIKSESTNFAFRITLTDQITGKAIENASVTVSFSSIGKEIVLVHKGGGVYGADESFQEITAFTTDVSFQGRYVVYAENYNVQSQNLQVTLEMEEIYEGIPTFYFIISVGSLAGLIGSLVGYRLYQRAKIPDFVKMIDKKIDIIEKGKNIEIDGDENSFNKIAVDEFGSDWEVFDLDMKKSLETQNKTKMNKHILTHEDIVGGNN